jgi:hypothetical protein
MARSAQEQKDWDKRANKMFWPPDHASISNLLVLVSLGWQVLSFLSNGAVSLCSSSLDYKLGLIPFVDSHHRWLPVGTM